ncbi:MAG: hypothetical protein HY675_13820 [Chloroflexi bacterium]|nr:hypothetical protein [Chloroflexota bacterium]
MNNSQEQPLILDEKTLEAVTQLEDIIRQKYPTAAFELSRSPEDRNSIHLTTIVDVDDPDEVGDLVIDRVVDLNVEEGIPIHVIPVRTPERIAAARRGGRGRRRSRPLSVGTSSRVPDQGWGTPLRPLACPPQAGVFLACLRINLPSARSTSFTESESGNISATSGDSTTTLLPAA